LSCRVGALQISIIIIIIIIMALCGFKPVCVKN